VLTIPCSSSSGLFVYREDVLSKPSAVISNNKIICLCGNGAVRQKGNGYVEVEQLRPLPRCKQSQKVFFVITYEAASAAVSGL
jgi:hypothetical protein